VAEYKNIHGTVMVTLCLPHMVAGQHMGLLFCRMILGDLLQASDSFRLASLVDMQSGSFLPDAVGFISNFSASASFACIVQCHA